VSVSVRMCVWVLCVPYVGYAGDSTSRQGKKGVQTNYLGRCKVVIVAQHPSTGCISHVNAYFGCRLLCTTCTTVLRDLLAHVLYLGCLRWNSKS
jgi:hypothetical protein